jgi:hypothetical protein
MTVIRLFDTALTEREAWLANDSSDSDHSIIVICPKRPRLRLMSSRLEWLSACSK